LDLAPSSFPTDVLDSFLAWQDRLSLKGGGDRTIKGGVQIALASLIVGQNRQIAAALFAIAVCL